MTNTNHTPTPPTAIYVHGLGSGAYSQSFKALSQRFPQFMWAMAEFGEDLAENVDHLNRLVSKLNPTLIIGTSLGGLTVLFADAPDAVKIACNPALSISECARNTIGLGRHEYLCQRIDGKTEFVLTEQMCDRFAAYLEEHHPSLGHASYALFAAHDELLGDEATAQAQTIVSAIGFDVRIDADGQHRITPSTIDLIAKCIAESCSAVPAEK